MTAMVDGRNLLVIEEIAIVFDDVSRIRWRRIASGWVLGDPWPDAEERRALQSHLDDGGTALVLTSHDPIRVEALASELPTFDADDRSPLEPVEVSVDRFDWLPEEVRLRGEEFTARQRDYWSVRPSLLRPPLSLDSTDPFWDLRHAGRITFAVIAPGITRARIERDLAHLLTYLRSYEASEDRALQP